MYREMGLGMQKLWVNKARKTGRDQIMKHVIHVKELGLNSESKGVARETFTH